MSTLRPDRGRWLVAVGLALPVLLFAALLAWRLLLDQEAPPPRHDLLLSVYQSRPDASVRVFYRVDDGRLLARVQAPPFRDVGRQVLYRYRAGSAELERVVHEIPAVSADDEPDWVDVPVLPQQTLSTDPTAPDGWTFRSGDRLGPAVFGWLFRGEQRGRAELVRRGARRPLPEISEPDRHGVPQFLGWVVAGDGS